MSRWPPLALFIALYTCVLGCAQHRLGPRLNVAQQSTTPQHTGFYPPEIDFGVLPWFTQIPFEFSFRNGSTEPQRIEAIKASCGCVLFDTQPLVGTEVAPGAETTMAGELDIGGQAGDTSREIQLMTETGAIYTAYLNYSVYQTFAWMPDTVQFGRIDVDERADDALRSVIYSSDEVAVIGQPTSDSAWLEAAVTNRGNGESEIAVHVVKRNLPVGRAFGRLTVQTSDENKPSFTIPVYAEGIAALRPVPSHLFLRYGGDGAVRFLTCDGAAARIASASCEHTGAKVRVAGNGTEVVVSCAGDAGEAPFVVDVVDETGANARFRVSVVR